MNLTQVPISMIDTAAGDAGKVLTSDGSTLSWTASGGSLTSGTAVTLTNQTSVDFTGIPSTVKRITVMLNGVSTNGTNLPILQVGAGSVSTTGYLGATNTVAASVVSSTLNPGNGVQFTPANWSATNVMHGSVIFENNSGNIWAFRNSVSFSDTAASVFCNGSITLAGSLDRVRLTFASGSNTFDAGTVNIMWE